MEPVFQHRRRCSILLMVGLISTSVTALVIGFYLWQPAKFSGLDTHEYEYYLYVLMALAVVVLAAIWSRYRNNIGILNEYESADLSLKNSIELLSSEEICGVLTKVKVQAKNNPLILVALGHHEERLSERIDSLQREELIQSLNREVEKSCNDVECYIAEQKKQIPIIKVERQIRTTLEHLKNRREEIQKQWDTVFSKMSWWNKLNATEPDFSEMDKAIKDLERIHENLSVRHKSDFMKIDRIFRSLKKRAISRIKTAQTTGENYINSVHVPSEITDSPLKGALMLSAMSLPVSLWQDVSQAGEVFDTLRAVNTNYANLSDSEIWWNTLLLSPKSLAGLVSLTKGAYLEKLVANDSDGELFEHFNHPDTDIVIDGIAYQIKATDSISYIETVDPDIPVIATTEIASITGAIDAGYSNEDLQNSVELALGGTILDVNDSVADAILTGVGGLGFFATLAGINRAAEKYNNGGDGVEAVFEGLEIAIEKTVKSLVDTAEMGYKILSSRPSRFIGRTLVKGFAALDKKFGDIERN